MDRTYSVHYLPGDTEPWIVRLGRKRVSSHYTLEAALGKFRREIERTGGRA